MDDDYREDLSQDFLKVSQQLKLVFLNLGLSGFQDFMDMIIEDPNGANYDVIIGDMLAWNENFVEDILEETELPVVSPRFHMVQLFDTILSSYDIKNIMCRERYCMKKECIVYTIVLNVDTVEGFKVNLADHELACFNKKEERDQEYRKLKNKLRFVGLKIV